MLNLLLPLIPLGETIAAWGINTLGVLLFFGASCHAASKLGLDLGVHADNVIQRTDPQTAGLSRLTAFSRARLHIPIVGRLQWEPSLGLLLPWRTDNEGAVRTLTTQLGTDFALGITSWMRWRAGVSLQAIIAMSAGQGIELNNGTGTSTFYSPGGISTAWLFLVGSGFEWPLSAKISIGVEVWCSQVLDSARRRLHGAGYLGVAL